MARQAKFAVMAVVAHMMGQFAGPDTVLAKKWDELSDKDIIPPAISIPDDRTFVVFGFSYKGRYFTNNKKYIWREHTSRNSAISNWKQWKQDGLGVHVYWIKGNKGQADTEKMVSAIYGKYYANKYSKGPSERPASQVPSIAGTTWLDQSIANETYWWFYVNGEVEMGASRRLASNDRGKWTQSGEKITTTIDGETWTIEGSRMSNGFRTLIRQ